MEENKEKYDRDWPFKRYSSKEDELADILKKKAEIMKNDIGTFKRIAEQYYGTGGVAEYSSYTWEDMEIWNASHLYTLIKYQKKDLLVQVGIWEFNTAVFTRRNIPELIWFSHSPLPLFVVTARADEKYKENNPKIFLDEHTVIYSPKGGEAELRINRKQKEHPINYGDSNGIMNYEDAILAIQNARIHKLFHNEKAFEQFSHKIKELQKYSYEELDKRSKLNQNFHQDDEKRELYNKIIWFLFVSVGKSIESMYELIQSFDTHKHLFIKQHS